MSKPNTCTRKVISIQYFESYIHVYMSGVFNSTPQVPGSRPSWCGTFYRASNWLPAL